MSTADHSTLWASAESYGMYVGRWSRLVADPFIRWLDLPAAGRWLDVGCGTGMLTRSVLNGAFPAKVSGIDKSDAFIAYARQQITDARVDFQEGDAESLPFGDGTFDAVVSGLVLNFVPDKPKAAAEMARVVKSGGTVAIYVWDYAGKMQMMRHFWDAAAALDPAARERDEGVRSPICRPEPLEALFTEAGLRDIAVRAIDVPTRFRDFDDYWSPFLRGHAPAPAYAMALDEAGRERLREEIRSRLPIAGDGSISLTARAWAMRGRR